MPMLTTCQYFFICRRARYRNPAPQRQTADSAVFCAFFPSFRPLRFRPMNTEPLAHRFYVWKADATVEGPLELPALVERVKGQRIFANTWVYAGNTRSWRLAADTLELRMFFGKAGMAEANANASMSIEPDILRRVRVLATLTDEQLVRFATFMDIVPATQFSPVVRQGEHGDAMFLILEGELRARLLVGDRETTLATLKPGDFFGEISLFDHGPRSADVVANEDSTLLKITVAACDALAKEAPDIAAAFLFGVGKTLAARIRADNKRLSDTERITRSLNL